jgi:hypothetical protein
MISILLAETDVFGTIVPPGPPADLGKVIMVLVNVFITVAAIFVFVYALWGTIDWIMAGEDKDKYAGARKKITNAFVGAIMLAVVIVVWTVVTGSILGIVRISNGIAIFKIPSLNDQPGGVGNGVTCSGGCSCSGHGCGPGSHPDGNTCTVNMGGMTPGECCCPN